MSRLPFLPVEANSGTGPAIYCAAAGAWATYRQLAADVATTGRAFAAPTKRLAFHRFANSYADVVAYLGMLAAGHCVALFDPNLTEDTLDRLIELYSPEWVVGGTTLADARYVADSGNFPIGRWRKVEMASVAPIHPDLCILLSTSGSTGSPKLVRLSYGNIAHNAAAIVKALTIDRHERTIAHLPLHYSFGLSVLHTHLLAGASLVLTGESVVSGGFWKLVRFQGCTSFSGTPYHFDMMNRLGLSRLRVPSLMTMAQAGGRLAPEMIQRLHEQMAARGGRFFVMYGQTEAGPRMTTLPSTASPTKMGSVGLPLHGAVIRILDPEGRPVPAGIRGEVVYAGPNVMMGYSGCRDDLVNGDQLGGILPTGDLGYLDTDGFLFIVGRTKRIAKVVGMRISLDEVERMASASGRVAAIEVSEGILVFAEGRDPSALDALRRNLARRLELSLRMLNVRGVDGLPATSSGKVDYARLQQMA